MLRHQYTRGVKRASRFEERIGIESVKEEKKAIKKGVRVRRADFRSDGSIGLVIWLEVSRPAVLSEREKHILLFFLHSIYTRVSNQIWTPAED